MLKTMRFVNVPDEEIIGAENIYKVLKTNLANIKETAKTDRDSKASK